MVQLEAYLTFDGNCADAMRFYERTFGGKLEALMRHGESPLDSQVSPGNANRIMHSRLVIDGRALMAADAMAGQPYEGMNGFSLSLGYPTAAEAQKVFDALAQGGEVHMALQKTFWADAFGMLVDRFGTPWMISGGLPKM